MIGYYNNWTIRNRTGDNERIIAAAQRRSDETFYRIDSVPADALEIGYEPARIMLAEAYKHGFSSIGFKDGIWYQYN